MGNKLYVIGIGPGSRDYINSAVTNVISQCEVIISGQRNLELFKDLKKEECVIENNLKELIEYIQVNIYSKKIAVIVTGDPGLYSLMEYLKKNLDGIEIEVMPGISAFQYLCAKLKISWNDIYITSLHGRENPELIGIVKQNFRTAVFAGGGNSPDKICSLLREEDIKNLKVTVGENLSYEHERIVQGSIEQIEGMEFDSLSIMIIENINHSIGGGCNSEKNENASTIGIRDDMFIRGNVPMTKEEIRTISVSKLRLEKNSVVCDIGAGTGSVTIECGRVCSRGRVYAVECNEEGIELIKRNIERFELSNVSVIEGKAPEILYEALGDIKPDRFFIGGTKGNMNSILEWITKVNKDIVVVINTITIESTYEAIKGLESYGFKDIEVTSISISKSVEAGEKHLMKAINPVTIISGKRYRKEWILK